MRPMRRDFWKSRKFENVSKWSVVGSCSNIFFCRHSLKQHYKSKLYECYCGLVYKNRDSIRQHQTGHFKENILCEVCKKVLTHNGFERHWRIHHLKELGPAKAKIQTAVGKEKGECSFCTLMGFFLKKDPRSSDDYQPLRSFYMRQMWTETCGLHCIFQSFGL